MFAMIYFTDLKEPINELPEETVSEFLEFIDHNNDLGVFSMERLCDCIAMENFPESIFEHHCLAELKKKALSASFEELMEFCRFLHNRMNITNRYNFPGKYAVYKLPERDDKDEIVNKLDEAGGLELLKKIISPKKFVEYSQNYKKNQ